MTDLKPAPKKGVDFIGVTTTFFCHDGQGNLLLQKRSVNCRDEQGRWDCGGGSLDFREASFEAGALREIREEYGVTPKSLEYVTTANVLRENGDAKTHWVALLFVAEVDRDRVCIMEPDKADEIGWFPIGSFPENVHSMLMRHFEMVRRRIPAGSGPKTYPRGERIRYDKLVRDRIIERMDARGDGYSSHVASEVEYGEKLELKLMEEVGELVHEKSAEELADVMEVLKSFAALHGIDLDEAAKIRREKAKEKGGFEKRIVLEETW